jgi:hypothetical protein
MYGYIVYLHVAGVFLFLLGHGGSANVAFQLKHERNPDRLRALLDLSVWSYIGMYSGLLLLLITGIIAGFMGKHWGRGWIWASIVLLVTMFVAMGLVGSNYYGKVRSAVGLQPYKRTAQVSLGKVASEAELAALLNSNRPWILTAIGFGGLLLILWLMMFKPF